jgi:hypothetical protein
MECFFGAVLGGIVVVIAFTILAHLSSSRGEQ